MNGEPAQVRAMQRGFVHQRGASLSIAWLTAGLLWARVALAAPRAETGLGLPHDASVDGFRIDRLIFADAWFALPLLAILVAWLLYAAFAHGRRHKAVYDPGGFRHPVALAVCLAAVAVLVADDALSWFASNGDLNTYFWNFDRAERQPNAVRIEIEAHQWAWSARYAGPDGVFNTRDDIVTLDDLRVPVGAPVLIELSSNDVIHDFYLPNFRVKQDVMPGQVSKLTFAAREAGEFDFGCAQHCGLNHYKMRGVLTVLARPDFERWVKEASAHAGLGFDPEDRVAHWGWNWATAERN